MKMPWWVVALGAVAATMLFNLTQILVLIEVLRQGGAYNYFTFLGPDAMVNLAPMLRDVLDGHLRIADGRVLEHVHLPSLWSNVTPYLVAPFILAARSVPYGLFVGRIVVVLVSFPLAYLIARRLVGDARWAMAYALLFFGPTFLGLYAFPVSREGIGILFHAIVPFVEPAHGVLLSKYNSFSVLPTLPIFLAVTLFLLVWLQEKKRWAAAAAGLSLGLLLSTYATSAIYLGAAIGMLFVGALVRRAWRDVRHLLLLGLAALPTGAYFIVNYFTIRALPHAAEFYDRLSGDITHAFRWSAWPEYAVYAALAAAVVWAARRAKAVEAGRLVAALLLSGIVVWNIQVLTGYNPAPPVWRIHQIFFGMGLAAFFLAHRLVAELRQRRAAWGKAAVAVLLLIATSATVQVVRAEVSLARDQAPRAAVPSALEASFVWIDGHAPRDAVFASPSLVSDALLPMRTHARVVMPRAITSPAPQEEILDRWLATYALFDAPVERFEAALRGDVEADDPYAFNAENGLPIQLYEYAFFPHDLDYFRTPRKKAIPEDVIRTLLERYRAYPRDLSAIAGKYRLDYLYVGPYEERFAGRDFDAEPGLTKVYDADGVRIYGL